MDESASFGYWVRRRRKSLDLTQVELARRVGCAAKTIQKFEADERRPSKVMAERLADALDVTPGLRSSFLGGARSGMWRGDEALLTRPADTLPIDRPWGGTLPVPMTPLIGRAREVAAVCDLLEETPARLVTLTGPGGVGKTRLALQVAAELEPAFGDGVVFVNLEPIRSSDLVPTVIAGALGLPDVEGQAIVSHLQAVLRERQLLLVLDNFEHVLAAATVVADLLTTAPRLKVLLTSRSVVSVYGEHDFPVPPLSLPNTDDLADLDRLVHIETVRLFVERARAARPDFSLTSANSAVVSGICHCLDGLPLAIELAAARVRLLPPQALLQRLTGSLHGGTSGRLQLLTGGPRTLPLRQQTLRNTLAWSYDLLDEGTQRLFHRLGVFLGGCTLEAVETVCGVDGEGALETLTRLQVLLDASLLEQLEGVDGQPRFSMLETIRDYALERLAANGEAVPLRERHVHYYTAWLEALANSAREARVVVEDRNAVEIGNLAVTFQWVLEQGDLDLGVRWFEAGFWVGLARYFGHVKQAWRRWYQSLMERRDTVPIQTRARALDYIGHFAWYARDLAQAASILEEALGLVRTLHEPNLLIDVLRHLADVYRDQDQYAQAARLYKEHLALAQANGNQETIALAYHMIAQLALLQEDYSYALELEQTSLVSFRDLEVNWAIYRATANAGIAAVHLGYDALAAEYFDEGLDDARSLDLTEFIVTRLLGYAALAASQRCYERAARLLGAIEVRQTIEPLWIHVLVREYARTMVSIRASLEPNAWNAAWAEGQAMTLEQAVAYALGETAPE